MSDRQGRVQVIMKPILFRNLVYKICNKQMQTASLITGTVWPGVYKEDDQQE